MKTQLNNFQTKYNLEERTAKFAENIIDLVRQVQNNAVNNSLVNQLIRSASSVGANYCEANEAESKSDFIHKIGICKKEIKETKHWIRLMAHANNEYKPQLREFWKESEELLLIFSAIIRNSKKPKV